MYQQSRSRRLEHFDVQNVSPGVWTSTPGNIVSRHSLPKCYPPQKYVAVAALLVYIGTVMVKGVSKKIPMVARVSVTDYRGKNLLDTYVRPTHLVEDYRTAETGLQYAYVANAPLFQDVQRQVAGIIRDKILVGHCLWNFLSILGLSHPAIETRDLALFLPLRRRLKCKTIVSLSVLVHRFMGRNIGFAHEDSVSVLTWRTGPY